MGRGRTRRDGPSQYFQQSRFQQQLSGDWNQQIVSKSDELKPLAKVMELIALLEEEKIAANQRLEEEYRKRQDMEEDFYRKQRQLLEEAASQIQTQAFASSSSSGSAAAKTKHERKDSIAENRNVWNNTTDRQLRSVA